MLVQVLTSAEAGIAAILAGGGLWAYLRSRRSMSGRVGTSQADQLWAQMQKILEMAQTRLDKTEEQRDKFIDSYSNTLLPALAAMREGIEQLGSAVAQNISASEQIIEMEEHEKERDASLEHLIRESYETIQAWQEKIIRVQAGNNIGQGPRDR